MLCWGGEGATKYGILSFPHSLHSTHTSRNHAPYYSQKGSTALFFATNKGVAEVILNHPTFTSANVQDEVRDGDKGGWGRKGGAEGVLHFSFGAQELASAMVVFK